MATASPIWYNQMTGIPPPPLPPSSFYYTANTLPQQNLNYFSNMLDFKAFKQAIKVFFIFLVN
jgi:hypothetical protein